MIACIRLPHFATALAERTHPELRDKPFVLLDEARQVVSGVSPAAARAGVRAGMGTAQARAQCADLLIRLAIPSRTQRTFEDLLAALTAFSDQVEPEDGLELRADGRRSREVAFLRPSQVDDIPAATCYLDLGKLKPEEALPLARQILAFVNQQTHIPARLGLSSGKFPARVAAASVNAGDLLVVPGGHEADFLAGFTAALLPVDGETLRQIDLLGWHTLGDIAAQPVAALLDRFGKPGRIMHRLAQGRDSRPVQTYTPPLVVCVTRELDGVTDWARLESVLTDAVAEGTTALFAEGQTVQHVALLLALEDGIALERQVMLRQPSGSARHVRETVRDMAQSFDVTAGVVALELALGHIAPAVSHQLSLFDRPAVPQAHLNTALKDLVARYGSTHFYWVRAVARDARLPERRYRWENADETE